MKIKLIGQTSDEAVREQIKIVAAAGKLSRFKGTANEIYEASDDNVKNLKFVERVLGMGHESIGEHDYIVITIEDVTPVVEQALIENRLCSFTIKSRREVDFRTAGFYTPTFRDKSGNTHKDNDKLQKIYQKHMQDLFDKYASLVDSGVPKEDARYVLPYCFHSNIIMGFDARELKKITNELISGELSNIAELKEIGQEFLNIIRTRAPYLEESLSKKKTDNLDHFKFLDEELYGKEIDLESITSNIKTLNGVQVTKYTQNPDDVIIISLLQKRYQISRSEAVEKYFTMSEELKRQTMKSIAQSDEKEIRALEQVTFQVEFPVSLANATHFARHRMHSPMFPRFIPIWNLNNYITPNTIKENSQEEYDQAYFENKAMYEEFKKMGVNVNDLVYFYQSGNTMNVSSTLNGRSIKHFTELRRCNKAQWEIRSIANAIANEVNDIAPLLGEYLGPSCMTKGICKEGRESCGRPIAPYTKRI